MPLKRVSFFGHVSPRDGLSDLVEFWRRPTPHRWPILGASIALTATMLIVLMPESQRVPPPNPTVTWITTFQGARSDSEIAASNRENQARKDRLLAEQRARAEQRKNNFRALARASGFDPDELERQFADDPPAPAPSAMSSAGAR